MINTTSFKVGAFKIMYLHEFEYLFSSFDLVDGVYVIFLVSVCWGCFLCDFCLGEGTYVVGRV